MRSDKEDLLQCMRIARMDPKVISTVLADTLSDDQKKMLEETDDTAGEEEEKSVAETPQPERR